MPRDRSRSPRRDRDRRDRSRSPRKDRNTRDRSPRRDRDRDSHRSHRRHRSRERRRSPPPARSPPRRKSLSPPPAARRSRAPLPDQNALAPTGSTFSHRRPNRDNAVATTTDRSEPPVEKQKPNFEATGLLAAASNTVNNVVLKYSEPADSRLPPPRPIYKIFVFKEKEIIETLDLNTKSCWLLGRDRAVVDVPLDHPSCSKQHAVWQFRYVVRTDEFGEKKGGVRLYVMDLESANGTWLAGVRIEGGRYVECRERDLIRFGESTREYVVMVDREG